MTKYLVSIVLLAACGSKSTPTSSTTTPTDEPAVAVLPEGVPFDDLDHDQRIEFMKQKVVPAMEPIFKKHDATKYAEFGCSTCHGKQSQEGHFDMPSTDLPKLDFKTEGKYKPEDLEWMGKEVKPTMAKLLGEAESSRENPTGFGCQNCHVIE